ncbi:MAG: protein kinase [Gemmatimonadetes bacterium]|nr:protein kinase [Gemmatimonadota bacterium]
MATVFLAQDLKHKRPVALKVLHPELAHALGPERFRREVELAARLQHPHILTVFDSGEAAGHLWFSMPYVEGESLRDRLTRERQLPVEDAVRIAIETARALEYAHEHGVVHRDIKPENILLTKDGSTLVADFGIARALQAGEEASLTETGLAVGTPAYMSPEQASGERQLDARTDVYSLGCVLYEMLAGEAPFTGPTVQAIIGKRLRGEVPDVRVARPSVPRTVGEAVTKALAPVVADRYATAGALAKVLSATMTASLTGVRPSAASAPPSVPGSTAKRRVPTGLALLLVGFLIGAGVLFAWRKNGHAGDAAASKVIAVLPFENQGDSTQEYFADGITDEVRGKLSALPGLTVIAGGSSRAYKHTDKPLAEVARELGATHLLVATVRWATNADGSLQVRVSPELVAVAGGTPTTKWQQAFDAALTNVFQVQADIAGQVAGALDVALADSVSRTIAAKPTGNLPAYDAFLRGEELFVTKASNSPSGLRQAIGFYKEALALDSNLVTAWAQLSRAHSLLYSNSTPDPTVASAALEAARRALALDSTHPLAHQALGAYYANVRNDLARARVEYQAALRRDPANAAVLRSISFLEAATGVWDSALVHAQLAQRLDPRSVSSASRLGSTLRALRRYAEARTTLERATAMVPTNLAMVEQRLMVELGVGDLEAARAVVRAVPAEVGQPAVVAYVANYWDLFWVLDDAQQRLLLSLTPGDFDGDVAAWGIVMAQTAWLRGDSARMRSTADTALAGFRQNLKGAPDDVQQLLFAGLAEAYLGRKADAIRDGEAAIRLSPLSGDASTAPYFHQLMARIYVLTGAHEKAIDILERLLTLPGDLSPGWLRIDPNFAALRGNPRFDRLIAARP